MRDIGVANTGSYRASAAGLIGAAVDLASAAPFAVGELRVDPRLRQLVFADGARQTLEPRVMEVFVALHRADQAVVSRDDLTLSCWGGNVVGEDALQRVIQRLRKVAAQSGAFQIETITKVGYRLVAANGAADGARGDRFVKRIPRASGGRLAAGFEGDPFAPWAWAGALCCGD